jgi:Icc protein
MREGESVSRSGSRSGPNGILIAQITDCHLPADPQQTYRGINPHKNLRTLLMKVRAMKPDLLLATGDLSEDGSRASYRALQEYFMPLGVPVLALPGNHDNAHLLAEMFPGSPVDTIGVSEHGPWQLIRLNSCLPGKPEGRLSEKTLADLEDFLERHGQTPQLISLHHQPIAIGSPWIDKYRLLDAQALLQLLDRYAGVKAVVWGHVHQVFETSRNGTMMLGGPSSAINALPGGQKFTPGTIGPACRWLDLRADETLISGVV